MIASIEFRGFRVLESATLPLGAFNLLVGPNGSGKTTALQALLALGEAARALRDGAPMPRLSDVAGARATFSLAGGPVDGRATLRFGPDGAASLDLEAATGQRDDLVAWLAGFQGHVLDPGALARTVDAGAPAELAADGAGLAAVLARIRSTDGVRWDALVAEFCRLLPEFTDVVAGRRAQGGISFNLATRKGHAVMPENLSQGSLVILGMLAIVFGVRRPSLLCLEELERGIHPRLLREVRDLLYRLSFPADCGLDAPAVQVVATTHSPYVLDLFADTPEDVILAGKEEGTATFRRLDEVPEVRELLAEGRLGDLWYSGILGGVE